VTATTLAAPYVGRFAPSPSGPLHRGSIAAALASYLDARANGGRWLLRIEDIDQSRSHHLHQVGIVDTLGKLGFIWDEKPWVQSQRLERYQRAFNTLRQGQLVYPCRCSRKKIADALSTREPRQPTLATPVLLHDVYPGWCRHLGASRIAPSSVRAWRLRLEPAHITWVEGDWLRRDTGGTAQQSFSENIVDTVGDFVIAKPAQYATSTVDDAAALAWTYQLSVVVDDEESGVTHVVRGMDLHESTSRQIYLQRQLGFRGMRYWHCPLVMTTQGQKLSKQNGAAAINVDEPVKVLNQALKDLGLAALSPSDVLATSLSEFWARAVLIWAKHLAPC
jgi:glutamyl-Q tRNA(Asp) synthetase